MNKFKERLEELRREKGVAYFTISKEVGINHTTIDRWASGKTLPSIDSIIVLSEYFNVTCGQLIGTEDL